MTLKNVHVVFVAISAVLCLLGAQLALAERAETGAAMMIPLALACAGAAIGLAAYGRAFSRRCRRWGVR